MKGQTSSIWKEKLLWVMIIGFVVALIGIFTPELNCSVRLTSIIGSVLSLFGGITAIQKDIPKVFHFSPSDWQNHSNGYKYLLIKELNHAKGQWPTYKILDNEGKSFSCDEEIITENGDIEFRIPSSYDGLSGRLHIK